MNNETKQKLNSFSGAALSTLNTIYNSYELAERCIVDGISGDFVECGVYGGTQIAAMAQACVDHGDLSRKIHLFDSFLGIPVAGPEDKADIRACIGDGDGSLTPSGVSICSADRVKENMRQWGIPADMLIYHEGWFQNTVPVDAPFIERIALLRLDGDLYESTRVCLDHLADKVQRGGYIVQDDNLAGVLKAVREYLDSRGLKIDRQSIHNSEATFWKIQ